MSATVVTSIPPGRPTPGRRFTFSPSARSPSACTRVQAEGLRADGENVKRLPGVGLPGGIEVTTVADIEFGGVDLVVLAVPCSALPGVIGRIGAHLNGRTAVLLGSKGLVAPLASTPHEYVAERLRVRAVASLAGPAHAAEALARGAAVVLATSDSHLRAQLVETLEAGGL